MKSYYDILGVASDASIKDIKMAYKKLALTIHPDKGGGTEEFQELNEAYSVLRDPEKRARYDRGEDAASPNTDEARARAIIAGLFAQASEKATEQTDIVGLIKQGLDQNMAQINKDIEAVHALVKKFTRLKERVKYKGNDIDMFAGVADQSMANAKRKVSQMEQQKEILVIALGMIGDYECETQPAQTFGTTSTTSTGWVQA